MISAPEVIKLLITFGVSKHGTPKIEGAIFTTFGWIIIIQIYSYWVNHFANYDIFYGSLSNIPNNIIAVPKSFCKNTIAGNIKPKPIICHIIMSCFSLGSFNL